jgi:hypothetical protein
MTKLLAILCAITLFFGFSGLAGATKYSVPDPEKRFGNPIEIPGGGTGTRTNPTPEPATMLLLGGGLAGLAAFGRKKFFGTKKKP